MFKRRMNVCHAKKTVALAMAAAMALMMPGTAFASGEAAGTYQMSDYAKKSLFGLATDFGVFAKESINFTSHSDTNFASKLVVIDRNISVGKCKIDPGISYASTWIQKDNNTNRLEDLNVLVLKKFGKGEQNADGTYKTADVTKEMIENPLQTIAGKNVDIQIEGNEPFINFDKEFKRLNLLSQELMHYMRVDIPYSADKQYYDYSNVKTFEKYLCLNLTAEQYESGRDLYIKVPDGKVLSINILNPENRNITAGSLKVNVWNGKEYEQLVDWTRMCSKVVLNVEGQGVVFDASNVITGGLLLAPGCDVKMGNHVGSVICNSMISNNGEVHYVRTTYPVQCDDVCVCD